MMRDAKRILVVEDDPSTRNAWSELIDSWGYQIIAAEDGVRALELVHLTEPDILLLDLKLPRKDGLEVLAELRDQGAQQPTIIVSGEGEIPDAVQSMKLGAYDYLRKPVDLPHLKVLLHNLSDHLNISAENRRLRQRLIRVGELGPLIGESPAMHRVMLAIEQVAPSNAPVIITGSSGCGKEIVARTIHDLSARRDGPYVAVNCAALPESLMESDLFGHERGAFTGADRKREGCFELARGGTLLLDEISEMRVDLQAKLLRVLEDQKVRRLGGVTEVPLDVRVLASSNRDLGAALREGKFRQDLFFRLNVFSIEVPPLRKRIEDLPVLINHFLHLFANSDGSGITGIDADCLEVMRAYSWPGNVRELRNVIQRAAVVARGPLMTVADLPADVTGRGIAKEAVEARVGCSLEEAEEELILRTLDAEHGNKVRTAEILRISLKTLYNRLGKYRAGKQSQTN